MKIRPTFVLGLHSLAGLVAALTSCTAPTTPEQSIEPARAKVIGGFPAPSGIDAVGSLVVPYTDEEGRERYNPFCSAALISQRQVLTAKHCAVFVKNVPVAFGFGPDGRQPKRIVHVVDWVAPPNDLGLVTSFGRDLAVLHLAERVTDREPMKLGTLDASRIGDVLVNAGYGMQDNSGTAGTRKAGKETLRALEGNIFEVMLGGFEQFFEWYTGCAWDWPPPDVVEPDFCPSFRHPFFIAYLRTIYDEALLVPGYSFVAGGAPGDSNTCFGDSGSPYFEADEHGVLTTYGVVSSGMGSVDQVCDFGTIMVGFGPRNMSLIERALRWEDPCPVSRTGVCEGSVAKRCTQPYEGLTRVVELDCALAGLKCVVDEETNLAGCTDGRGGFKSARPRPPRQSEEDMERLHARIARAYGRLQLLEAADPGQTEAAARPTNHTP
ncbi:MAG: S1 family peptidase [Proteobacteria bacterium]|nr:S1 family peptidase [Pseudomonadota bacterium]